MYCRSVIRVPVGVPIFNGFLSLVTSVRSTNND
jgi:hypothetical protein